VVAAQRTPVPRTARSPICTNQWLGALVGRDVARFDRERKPGGRTPTARAQASNHTGTWQPRWATLRAPRHPDRPRAPPRPSSCGSLRAAGLIDAKSIDLRRLPGQQA
jgi:hypothetical protein